MKTPKSVIKINIGENNVNILKIGEDLLKEVAFTFYQEMMNDDSWIKQYERETG